MSADSSRAVFLSYASQDAEAARRVCDALRAAGVEVWFDQSELRGGDAWDQKIRRQIKECALFVPLISANTQARREGYFRREWNFACDRLLDMTRGTAFVVPIVVDSTADRDALVPEEFLRVQWTRLPDGPTPQFVEQIQRLRGTGTAGPTVASERERDGAGAAQRPPPGRTVVQRRSIRAWVAAAVGVIGIGMVVFLVTQKAPPSAAPVKPEDATKPAAGAVADVKSVAVLPFANLSAERDNEYFSDGLTENILDKLARNPGLRVMARTSSFFYKGKNLPITQIAQELRVGSIIEGSVQRAGQRLRITAQLINAADGAHVWSETFDRELTTTDIFAVQDEIALKIAARLAPNNAPMSAEPRPTNNLEAYDAYLRGRELDWKGASTHHKAQAAEYYQRATELDPTFALAWARLGSARAWCHHVGGVGGYEDLTPARRAIDEAQRLQPNLVEARLARSAVAGKDGFDFKAALLEIERAERIASGSSEVLARKATTLWLLGRYAEALELGLRSIASDPRNGDILNVLGIINRHLGKYDEATQMWDRAVAVGAGNFPRGNKIYLSLYRLGDRDHALRMMDEIPSVQRDSRYYALRAYNLMTVGEFAGALEALGHIDDAPVLAEFGYEVRELLAARVKERMGDTAGAAAEFAKALPLAEAFRDRYPNAWRAYPRLAVIYAGLGRKQPALDAAHKCLELLPPQHSPYYASSTLRALVEVQSRFGLMDEALAIAKQQADASEWRRNELRLWPELHWLRQDPRFQAIIDKASL